MSNSKEGIKWHHPFPVLPVMVAIVVLYLLVYDKEDQTVSVLFLNCVNSVFSRHLEKLIFLNEICSEIKNKSTEDNL